VLRRRRGPGCGGAGPQSATIGRTGGGGKTGEEREGEEESDRWGHRVRERESARRGKQRGTGLARAGPRGGFGPGKGEEEGSLREGEKDLGRLWPTREEKRRPEREKGLDWLGSFLFLFSFPTQSIHTNLFEFKQV
jgi:hypothetical protein